MRILYAGTPEIAVPSLTRLAEKHEVVAVLTAPDRGAGRGQRLEPSPTKDRAIELGIPVVQPDRLGRAAREMIRPFAADILVCVAYGRIFGPLFLGIFPRGGINLHPSLLPKYRGPAPIQAAILEGEPITGVTVQELASETDSGDIYAQREIPLTGRETAETLTATSARIGAELLLEVVDAIEAGRAQPVQQKHEAATFSRMIGKEDGRINWNAPAAVIERMVRAYFPWPLSFTFHNGRRLNILEAGVCAVAPSSSSAAASGSHAQAGEEPFAQKQLAQKQLAQKQLAQKQLAQKQSNQTPGTVIGVDKAAGILVQTGDGVLSVRRLQLQNKRPLDWKSFLNGTRNFPGSFLGG